MPERVRIRRKRKREQEEVPVNTSNSGRQSFAIQRQFTQAPVKQPSNPGDLYKRTERYGHHPDKISVFPDSQTEASPLQPKLRVTDPQHATEQEADQVSQQVVSHQSSPQVQPNQTPVSVVQRQSAGVIQRKPKPSWTSKSAVKELPEDLHTYKSRKDQAPDNYPIYDGPEVLTQGALAKHGKDLNACNFSTPEEMSDSISKRFPKGPLLTDNEVTLIKKMSKTREGDHWLSLAGIFTEERARQYLKDHKYQAWLKLDAANRIWLAHLAWRDPKDANVEGTPPYNLGRSIDSRDPNNGNQAGLKQSIDNDIQEVWKNTLATPPQNLSKDARKAITEGGAINQKGKAMDETKVRRNVASANDVMKRILILLHSGLQVYSKKNQQFEDYTGSVVRALSHGGRVNIRIPALASKNANAYELMEWLGLTDSAGKRTEQIGLFERSFGTHHLAIGKNKANRPGKFREQGGAGAAASSKLGSTQMYGMNLAVGGLGNLDFNGDVILPDGAHGHMLIFYRPPTIDRDGGLMIGIETTGPHAPSTVGYAHTAKSSEATANPESSFGGLKTDKIGEGSAATQGFTGRYKNSAERTRSDNETLGRLVDLRNVNGGKWLEHLNDLKAEFDNLATTADEVTQIEELIGKRKSLKEWQDLNA